MNCTVHCIEISLKLTSLIMNIVIDYFTDKSVVINQFTLWAAKTDLRILEILHRQKFYLKRIWGRKVNQKPKYNSPSNILWTFALFPSYFQNYESSRRYFPEKLMSVNGLRSVASFVLICCRIDLWMLKAGTQTISHRYEYLKN